MQRIYFHRLSRCRYCSCSVDMCRFHSNMVPSKCVRTVIVVVPVAQKQQRKRVDDEWEHALRLRQALPLLQHMQHVIEVPRVQRVGAAKESAKNDGNECQDHLFECWQTPVALEHARTCMCQLPSWPRSGVWMTSMRSAATFFRTTLPSWVPFAWPLMPNSL